MAPELTDEQPLPVVNQNPFIYDLLITDMEKKDRAGAVKYGTRLQGFNGRDALIDAYQEVLDLAVYLRQKIWEETGA